MEKSIVHALMREHRALEALFDRVEDEPALLGELRRGLYAHAKAEELVVYPRFHQILEISEDVREAYGEHEDLERRMGELDPEDPRFRERLHELKQAVVDHVAIEEGEIFLIAKLELEPDESEELAAQYEAVHQRFELPSSNDSASISSASSPL
jgi:hemerythrin superfamily protein